MAASGFWRARLCVHLGAKKKAPLSLLFPEIRFHLLRNFATGDPETEELLLPFSAAYLETSFGFSSERAKSWSKYLSFKTPEKPDSVVTFLKEQGFTDAQISSAVRPNPRVLLFCPRRLLPKLQFFRSIGCSDADVCAIFSKNPDLLRMSLENRIIPCYNLLKAVLLLDSKVIRSFQRPLVNRRPEYLASNIRLFRDLGTPHSAMCNLLQNYPHIAFTKPSVVKKHVDEIAEMGLEPSTTTFSYAVAARACLKKETWESKFEFYSRWGWSREDTVKAFVKCQHCMNVSEKKIHKVMDLLVNKMGWASKEIAIFPYPLMYSMEKRLVPRCSVALVLRLKDLIREDDKFSSLLISREKYFISRYITMFEESVPQLMSLYKGQIGLADLGITPIVP